MSLPKTFKVLVSGGPGTGKTTFGLSFPKIAYIGTEPNGLDVARSNPELESHLVLTEEFLPSITEDVKATFQRMEDAILYAHQQAKDGKVETLILDNLTFLSLNRWIYIEKYERKTAASGEVDTRAMYGNLGMWLYRFILLYIISFPGHVVIVAHDQRDDEADMKRALNPSTPITPDVLGAMKYRIQGLVSASLFLNRKLVGPNKWKFYARCIEGDGKAAKNRYGLPEIVEDISYQKLVDTLQPTLAPVATTGGV